MLQMVAKGIKWVSIPVLLIASLFLSLAGSYAPLAGLVICMAAIILVQRAVWSKQYYWAAGFASTFVMFSSLFLAEKVFLSMGFVCAVVFMALSAAFRSRPLPAEIV